MQLKTRQSRREPRLKLIEKKKSGQEKKKPLPNYKQSEKDHMIPLICGILKNDTNELTKQKQTHRLGK